MFKVKTSRNDLAYDDFASQVAGCGLDVHEIDAGGEVVQVEHFFLTTARVVDALVVNQHAVGGVEGDVGITLIVVEEDAPSVDALRKCNRCLALP